MFSKDLEFSIGQCYKQARESRHEFMTVEHLLLALLENPSAMTVLNACGVDQNKLLEGLKQVIVDSVPVLAANQRVPPDRTEPLMSGSKWVLTMLL